MTDTEILNLLADNDNWADTHGAYPLGFCPAGTTDDGRPIKWSLVVNCIPWWIEDKRNEI